VYRTTILLLPDIEFTHVIILFIVQRYNKITIITKD